jgi:ornithine cyclodeaminase/alanine dehydrogenase
MAVLQLDRVFVWSRDRGRAAQYSAEMGATLGVRIVPVSDPNEGAGQADVIVTCTPARTPFLRNESVKPGTFIAAVGADSPDKQELDSALLGTGAVICDVTAQCAHVGELHHAIEAGILTASGVRAELGEVIAGMKLGRQTDQEIVIFDSTGTALQDVASAAAVYERAIAAKRGTPVTLSQ